MKTDTTSRIMSMLADRYTGSEWAYVTEVPDRVGGQTHRRIDAIAIGVKASNVGEFHGFEVKSSRADWKRDLEYPEKSKSWRNLVTSFWLVAGRGVAKLEEIPPKWGFLEVASTGTQLKIRKQPWEENRKDVPIEVVGSILKRGLATFPRVPNCYFRNLSEAVVEFQRSADQISDALVETTEHGDDRCDFFQLKALAEYVGKSGRADIVAQVMHKKMSLTKAASIVGGVFR